MVRKWLLVVFLCLLLLFWVVWNVIPFVHAQTYIGLKRVTVGESPYPENIIVSKLTENYEVRLYNATNSVANATVASDGNATLSLPSEYRVDTFEGTFKIYDTDGNHIFTEVFDDTRGGDEYEALLEGAPKGFVFAIGVTVVLLIVMISLPVMLLRRK